MIISINGSLGSGKSTVAKSLAKNLGFTYLSSGAWFRELAKERGLDVIAMNEAAEKDKSIDELVDSRLKALNDSQENLIVDSRMAPIFIENSIKIRLIVSEEEGAKRIFHDAERGNVESFAHYEAAIEGYRRRAKSERERYFNLYGVNLEDVTQYDLVLDTSDCTPEEIEAEIQQYIQNIQETQGQ